MIKYWTQENQKISTAIMSGNNEKTKELMRQYYPTFKKNIWDIRISGGNNKVGNTWNFSLPALFSCGKCAHETCGNCQNGKYCYAFKDYRNPSVVAARFSNWYMCMHQMEKTEKMLSDSIARHEKACQKHGKESVVRLHESGDFYSDDYMLMWFRIAEKHPDTLFYTYSTRYELMEKNYSVKPENFKILPSGWEGREVPADLKEKYGETTVIDKKEDLPDGFFLCPGTGSKDKRKTCEACKWQCAKRHKIAFIYHN